MKFEIVALDPIKTRFTQTIHHGIPVESIANDGLVQVSRAVLEASKPALTQMRRQDTLKA